MAIKDESPGVAGPLQEVLQSKTPMLHLALLPTFKPWEPIQARPPQLPPRSGRCRRARAASRRLICSLPLASQSARWTLCRSRKHTLASGPCKAAHTSRATASSCPCNTVAQSSSMLARGGCRPARVSIKVPRSLPSWSTPGLPDSKADRTACKQCQQWQGRV